jgi:hypothetical protein
MRRPRIEQEQFPQIVAPHATFDEPHWRQTDALLKDARRITGLAARDATADIRVVRDGNRERDRFSVNENRCGGGAIVQMRDTDDVGVVGKENIAWGELINREALEDRRSDLDRRAEMRRRVRGDGQRTTLQIAQRGRTIGALLYIRRIGAPDQTGAHLCRRCFERSGDDLDPRVATRRHQRCRSSP